MMKRATTTVGTSPKHSPSITAVPFGVGPPMLRLSGRDREHLATIATPMRVDTGTVLFRRGEEAHSLYSVVFGTMCTYREGSDGSRRVLAFLFAGDLTGLARRGVYVNTVKAITPASLFRFPMDTLTALLTRDAGLQFRFLCKTTHFLRETQRQAIMITRQDPVERVAMFLSQLEEAQGRHSRERPRNPAADDAAGHRRLPESAGQGDHARARRTGASAHDQAQG